MEEELKKLELLAVQTAQIEILTWAMKICGSGQTPSMIRRLLYNRLMEITSGEKA